jgi:prepilin-type N-terminal cleavage/methylation domain-containing protein
MTILRSSRRPPPPPFGFTLVELLVVISIIAILMGLLFPTVNAVKNQAKKVQAKNDVTQLVVAVKAYYTEYGKYPLPTGSNSQTDFTYDSGNSNQNLMKILMGDDHWSLNPRRIQFLEPSVAKGDGYYGVQLENDEIGEYLDPWVQLQNSSNWQYRVRIDSDYDGRLRELGTGTELRTGCIAWSVGRDGEEGTSTTDTAYKDNVFSWK